MVRKYYQDIANLKEKYTEKQQKYKNAYNRLLRASTGASTVGVVSDVSTIGIAFTVVGLPISASLGVVSTVSTCVGACLLLTSKKYKKKLLRASTGASTVGVVSDVSTIGIAFTVVGLPISASLGVVSTVSTCVGACLLLTSKKYKKKLLKCYDLLDKITSSLATFEILISLSIDDGTVIDTKEFHKLQTLYLQLMTYVRNIDRKMKVQTEENFQKTIMDEITNLKKALEQK